MSNILDPLSDSDESDRDEVYQPPRRVNLSNNSSNNPTSGNRKRQAKTISVLYKNNKKRRDQVLQDNYFTNTQKLKNSYNQNNKVIHNFKPKGMN